MLWIKGMINIVYSKPLKMIASDKGKPKIVESKTLESNKGKMKITKDGEIYFS